MKYTPLPPKAIKAHKRELLKLHIRCCKSYLVSLDLSYKNRRGFFILYDRVISERNILDYFNIPINLFCQHLVKNTLNSFFRYGSISKSHRKSVRRKK